MARLRARALLYLLATAAAGASCADRELPRRAQLLLYVDTDAPLALPPGQWPSPSTPTPLFDRLRIEVLTPEGEPACEQCTEDFSVDQGQLAEGRISFGVLPSAGPLVARARLFRGVRARGGVPVERATIDRAFALPVPAAGELREVTLFLPLEGVGVPADLASPEAPLEGKVVQARVHDAVVPRPCATEPAPGREQVCVRGGAYWMSDPLLGIGTDGQDPPERIAVVSPFWVDKTEVTVGQLRAAGDPPDASELDRSRGASTECTFTDAPGPNEALPVTCISWQAAARYCERHGARLLTEAEFEFMAGARSSQRAPWGQDKPRCEDAVLARADPTGLDPVESVLASCSNLGIGPAAPGSGVRDVLRLDEGDVFDLLGNVTEWVADEPVARTDPCVTSSISFDRVCKNDPPSPARVSRGGHYMFPLETRSTQSFRFAFGGGTAVAGARPEAVGFRCARDGSER